jgi:hypothetical protein
MTLLQLSCGRSGTVEPSVQAQTDKPEVNQSSGPDTIRAKRFEVIADAGKVQVVISAEKDGAAGISVPNETNRRAWFGLRPSGDPMVTLFSSDGKDMASLWVRDKDGGPAVTLASATGQVILAAGSTVVGVSAELFGTKVGASLLCVPKERLAAVGVTDTQGQNHGIATDGDVLRPRP